MLVLVVLLAAVKIRDLKATTAGAVAVSQSNASPGAFANAMYDDTSGATSAEGNTQSGYMDVEGHEEKF